MSSSAPAPFPRHIAIGTLLFVGCVFAGNHIGARLAFDAGAGVLLAIIFRTSLAALALGLVVARQRYRLRLPSGTGRWQALLGLCFTFQSIFLYSAVARIPVGLALLVASMFPLLLALLNWATGGPAPTRRALLVMVTILVGLTLVLDLPGLLTSGIRPTPVWMTGVTLAFGACCIFTCGLWITEHKLTQVPGAVRSFYAVSTILCLTTLLGATGLIDGAMNLPRGAVGWAGLLALALLYTLGFCTLFLSFYRLDITRNAPIMNIEPVATLFFGWLILDQAFNTTQLTGMLVVISGIIMLAYTRAR